MKIVVVGPGAMGCLFAGALMKAGQKDVWLFDKDEHRAREITENGLKIEGIAGAPFVRGVKATVDPREIGIADLVLICVKSYDTAEASGAILPSVGDRTIVLTLQNGLTNVEVISRILGEDKVVAGVTSHGATMLGPGHIRHAGIGETVVGEPRGIGDFAANSSREPTTSMRDFPHRSLSRAEFAADILRSAGFQTLVSRNIYSSIWAKLVVNAAINPLTAITRLRNGELLEHEETRRLLSMTAEEAARVATARHAPLPYENVTSSVEAVCRATASNVSSMLQDILRGKHTEIDAINGAIVSEAKKAGLETPINETLTYLVKGLESDQIRDP